MNRFLFESPAALAASQGHIRPETSTRLALYQACYDYDVPRIDGG